MSEDKSGKHRWRDPIILVPIITAVIAAIVGPTYVWLLQNQDQTSQQNEESAMTSSQKSTSPPPEPTPTATNITVETDKQSYRNGEVVTISGNVSKPESGKSLRIDVYNPNGDTLFFANGIKVYPNGKGFYTYDMGTDIMTIRDMDGEIIPGKYEVLVTYLNQSAKETFELE